MTTILPTTSSQLIMPPDKLRSIQKDLKVKLSTADTVCKLLKTKEAKRPEDRESIQAVLRGAERPTENFLSFLRFLLEPTVEQTEITKYWQQILPPPPEKGKAIREYPAQSGLSTMHTCTDGARFELSKPQDCELTALVCSKLDGLNPFERTDMLFVADSLFQEGYFDKAAELYELICEEFETDHLIRTFEELVPVCVPDLTLPSIEKRGAQTIKALKLTAENPNYNYVEGFAFDPARIKLVKLPVLVLQQAFIENEYIQASRNTNANIRNSIILANCIRKELERRAGLLPPEAGKVVLEKIKITAPNPENLKPIIDRALKIIEQFIPEKKSKVVDPDSDNYLYKNKESVTKSEKVKPKNRNIPDENDNVAEKRSHLITGLMEIVMSNATWHGVANDNALYPGELSEEERVDSFRWTLLRYVEFFNPKLLLRNSIESLEVYTAIIDLVQSRVGTMPKKLYNNHVKHNPGRLSNETTFLNTLRILDAAIKCRLRPMYRQAVKMKKNNSD